MFLLNIGEDIYPHRPVGDNTFNGARYVNMQCSLESGATHFWLVSRPTCGATVVVKTSTVEGIPTVDSEEKQLARSGKTTPYLLIATQ